MKINLILLTITDSSLTFELFFVLVSQLTPLYCKVIGSSSFTRMEEQKCFNILQYNTVQCSNGTDNRDKTTRGTQCTCVSISVATQCVSTSAFCCGFPSLQCNTVYFSLAECRQLL